MSIFARHHPYADALYRMIGDAMMRVLLLQTTVFLPVDGSDNNFILLCGTARSTSARQVTSKKLQTPEGRDDTSAWKANNLIPRQSLFYSQAYARRSASKRGTS